MLEDCFRSKGYSVIIIDHLECVLLLWAGFKLSFRKHMSEDSFHFCITGLCLSLSPCLYMQNIPAAGVGRHLGLAWAPGDILVYETLYKTSGMCWYYKKPPSPSTNSCLHLYCLMSLFWLFLYSIRCCRIRVSLHPWGPERWRHIFPHFTETFQWVTSHLCRAADNWRGPSQQKQKSPVRQPDEQVSIYVIALLSIDIILHCKSFNQACKWWNAMIWSLDLSASVKTIDLWFEPVWRSFSKLQVRIRVLFLGFQSSMWESLI